MVIEAVSSTVLVDGLCVLCTRSYRFVARRDKAQAFRFVPIQSPLGRSLAICLQVNPDQPDTFVLVEDGKAYFRAEAVLRIGTKLPGWGWLRLLRAVPSPILDALYGVVARNRYRWFGQLEPCEIPRGNAD